jgi:hypothetical protein
MTGATRLPIVLIPAASGAARVLRLAKTVAVPADGRPGGRSGGFRLRRGADPAERAHQRRIVLAAAMLHEPLAITRKPGDVKELARCAGAARAVAPVASILVELDALFARLACQTDERGFAGFLRANNGDGYGLCPPEALCRPACETGSGAAFV